MLCGSPVVVSGTTVLSLFDGGAVCPADSVVLIDPGMWSIIARNYSGAPNPEVIEAQLILFGAAMTAAALIWGAKKVYRLFSPSVESVD